MPIFTRFLCCLLAAIFLVACNGSDSNSNSNSNTNSNSNGNGNGKVGV